MIYKKLNSSPWIYSITEMKKVNFFLKKSKKNSIKKGNFIIFHKKNIQI